MMEKQKINFRRNGKPEFTKELRERVSAYFTENNISRYGNLNLGLKSVFMLLLYLAPYLLMVSGVISSFGLVLVCWILIGLGKAGVGMGIMHDAIHRSYSKNQKINRLMGNTLYLLGGFPPNWRHQHNTLHHGFTNIEGHDEDIDPGAYLRLSPHKPHYRIHRLQHIYAWFLYGLMTLMWVTTKEFRQLYRYSKEGVSLSNKWTNGQLLVFLILSKIIYYIAFLVIPMLVLPFAWYWVLFFFFSMHFTAGFILTTIFQTAHVVTDTDFPLPDASGDIENDWVVHQLYTTSNFAPDSRIFGWLTGGLNHQVEHHLFPNISHIHYRKISGIVKEVTSRYGIPYHVQNTFLHAVISHGRMLNRLGRRPVSPA